MSMRAFSIPRWTEYLPVKQANRRIFFVLLTVGLLLRFLAVATFHPPLISDDREYIALGTSLANGEGYQLEGHATAYRLPAYPLILAFFFRLFGASLLPVRLLQLLADMGSCLLIFMLGRKLFGERTGLLAMGLMAVFPIQILYVPMLMTETLYAFFLLLILWLVLGSNATEVSILRCVGLGALIGWCTLMREITLILPLVLLIYAWRSKVPLRSLVRPILITSFVAALFVGPWLVRNYQTFERFAFTSNSGVNFWIGNHKGASGSYSFPVVNNPLRSVEDDFERSDLGYKLGLEFIAGSPLNSCALVVKKYVYFFAADYWLMPLMEYKESWATYTHAVDVYREISLWNYAVVHIPFACILILATFGFVFAPGPESKKLSLLLMIACLWIAVHLVVYANARYRFPIQPLLVLVAASGWSSIQSKSFQLTVGRTLIFTVLVATYFSGWVVALWLTWGSSFRF